MNSTDKSLVWMVVSALIFGALVVCALLLSSWKTDGEKTHRWQACIEHNAPADCKAVLK